MSQKATDENLAHEYKQNDCVDLLDENDVYCPGKISSVIRKPNGKISHFMIAYVGWPIQDYPPEKVDVSSPRIKPHRSCVLEYKAWVKYSPNLPMWPSKVYVRTPRAGSKEGLSYLEEFEQRVLVMPYGGGTKQMKPFNIGAWFKASKVKPINDHCDQRIEEACGAPRQTESATAQARRKELRTSFNIAWNELEEDTTTEVFDFEFCPNGSLEVNRCKAGALTAREEENKRKMLEEGREREYKRLRYEKRQHLDLYLPPAMATGGKIGRLPNNVSDNATTKKVEDEIRRSLEGKESLMRPPSPATGEKVNYFAKISALRMLLARGNLPLPAHKDAKDIQQQQQQQQQQPEGNGTYDATELENNDTAVAAAAATAAAVGTSSSSSSDAVATSYVINVTDASSSGLLGSIMPNTQYVDL